MDIIVVTSTTPELLLLALMEAMASRRPMLATRVGGIAEIVEEARMGCLLSPGDAGAMADALLLLADCADARRQRGEAANDCVQSHFALPHMLDETQQLYERLHCEAPML